MLETPFGKIEMSFDGVPCEYKPVPVIKNEVLYPDVNEVYLLPFDFYSDGRKHILKCELCGNDIRAYPETGERLEAVAVYLNGGKLNIGIEGDFDLIEEYGYDFGGNLTKRGVEIYIDENTCSRRFMFGIAWLLNCTDENDVQTWFAADPTITFEDNAN